MTIKARGGLCPFCKYRPDIRPQVMPSSQNLKNSLPHGRRPYKHRREVPRSGTTNIGARPDAAPAPPCGPPPKRSPLGMNEPTNQPSTENLQAEAKSGNCCTGNTKVT